MPIKIAVLKETKPGEKRVSMVPSVVQRLERLGASAVFERGAGTAATFDDGAYSRGLRANDVKNHVNRLTYCFILIIRCCIYSYSNDHGADGRWNAIPSRLIA